MAESNSIIQTESNMFSLSREFKSAVNVCLHELCTMQDVTLIKQEFESAYMGRLSQSEFRGVLKKYNIEYTDDEYKILFLKMNARRDGLVDWDEFISYLITGFYENDVENQRVSVSLPIVGLPNYMRSHHRHQISKILFCPDVDKNRTKNEGQGMYLTVSRDGMINWWSLDMGLMRTRHSTCPNLKVQTTWVTDFAVMPDVNIIVVSSTERETRFYDCTAKTFTLKIIITSWDFMICTMYYHFHKDINENNLLICGDTGGNIRILAFSPILRGPFQNKPGTALIQLRHIDVARNRLPGMKLIQFRNIHTDWVRQVSYYTSLNCFVSCSTSTNSLLICDLLSGKRTYNMFHLTKGVLCFTFDDEKHLLVTGGPDCIVRIWNSFVTAKPLIVLPGHHTGIITVILQNNATLVYSVSRDCIIKVWDLHLHACIQTYTAIAATSSTSENSSLSCVYNDATRVLTLASSYIASIILDEQLNSLHTDGFTHSREVSCVIYNNLFKIVVTCCSGSMIMVWDPFSGKRILLVKEAHTQLLHGELMLVEITAACFDPGNLLLLTGARNGTLKVWNFNAGTCLRNMCIESMCSVTSVFWVEGRIFAVGWNKHITEFEDSGTALSGKSWETWHAEDIFAASIRSPSTFVTASYDSQLVMWKLETGQPYRRYLCTDPTRRIKMVYTKKGPLLGSSSKKNEVPPDLIKKPCFTLESVLGGRKEFKINMEEAIKKAYARRIPKEKELQDDVARPLAVHAMIFLPTREMDINVVNLLISLENGMIQCWSDHSAGGYKCSFQGVHTVGDYVSTFATDLENDYLMCGTTVGYIKIYLMKNFMTKEPVHVNMPKLRLLFPFLWKDRIPGRAKRCVKDQPLPLLCCSYRAHMRCITALTYIDERKLMLSGSSDKSVRVWKLSGEYLQTLGSFLPYTLDVHRYPPDVKKVASFTTMKVWNSGVVSRYTPGQKVIDIYRDITDHELKTKTFGYPVDEPLLGKYFHLPKRPDRQDKIVLDDSLQTIPIYVHLRLASSQPVKRPPTPPLVKETRLKAESDRNKRKSLIFRLE